MYVNIKNHKSFTDRKHFEIAKFITLKNPIFRGLKWGEIFHLNNQLITITKILVKMNNISRK